MLLVARDIEKSFATRDGALPVLRGVDLTLVAGRSLALTGDSGSGKSTLLHLLGALDTPDRGTIEIDGRDVTAMSDRQRAKVRRESVGLVFQQFNLIPSLNVADNLAFQARLSRRHDPEWISTLAARLGLKDHLRHYPEQLSGGQQQRVAIGRALAGRPPLLLADEPTGNLDEATGDAVMDLMLQLVRDTGAGLLMVTHSRRLAERLDTRLLLRAGKLA
ncbi:ABC transporter ATP-binding protein [Brevirhabdus sp.]|uniref:ABC transporter ATP-binding protein n=1 Tax=Brevirhabdus sp. TaxID=2004514 RepID=UPI0040588E38